VKVSQRLLIVGSLAVLAIAMSCYCLDYQMQLLEPQWSRGTPLIASPVLIKFREAIIAANPFDQFDPVRRVAVSGLYPRGSMTPNMAAIGDGLLMPFLLLVAAHLGVAPSDYVEHTIAELRAMAPDVVIPMHCTGRNFVARMRAEMPEQLVDWNTRRSFTFGV